jgi:hypothetical protein
LRFGECLKLVDRFRRAEIPKWAAIVKASGAKLE